MIIIGVMVPIGQSLCDSGLDTARFSSGGAGFNGSAAARETQTCRIEEDLSSWCIADGVTEGGGQELHFESECWVSRVGPATRATTNVERLSATRFSTLF